MTDAEIESLIGAFEDGSLPRSEWTHARHLLMALWYLRHHGRDEATGLVRDGIRRYNERQDNRTGYHETITLAWVAVIRALPRGTGSARPRLRARRGVAGRVRRQGLPAAVLLQRTALLG